MRITPINFRYKTQKATTPNNTFVSNVAALKDNIPPKPYPKEYMPHFGGLIFETNVIRKVLGKKFHGYGLYTRVPEGTFIDCKKINYKKLASEAIDITKASKDEITAYRFSLALIETYAKNPDDASEFATQWVKRYNPDNRHSPLAVSHSLNDFDTMEEIFAKNREMLRDPGRCKSLDIPITDKDGNLCLDAVVFDTETTGTNTFKDKIIQIGARLLKGGKAISGEKGIYNQLINPEIPIPPGASAVNGISDDMVKDAPAIESAMGEFLGSFMNKMNGVIVAWNGVKFDVPLLNRTIRELRDVNNITKGSAKDKIMAEKPAFKVLDPQIILQRIHPFLGASKKLSDQYHWLFCKPMDNAHDALADVNGTIPMLKYTLYWLSEHRTNKSVPLTLRQVLLFQNGAPNIPEIQPILHPTKNFNSRVKFDVSYRPENLDLINYFDKYHLDEGVLDSLASEIGEANIAKIKAKGLVGTEVSEKYKGHNIQAAETKKVHNSSKKISLSYVMRENFKNVLKLADIEEFNGKSKDEIEALIMDQSKVYLDGESQTLWLKNVNPDDMELGNDLPDDNITRKVMREMQNEESGT